jgi:hypothetical protein
MLAALSLLMGYVLGIAETPVTDEKMIGQRIRFLGRQQPTCLLVYKLAGAVMDDSSCWTMAWGCLSSRFLGAAVLRVRILLE